MTEPHIDWPTELQRESRREPENAGVGLLQILPSRAGSYDEGGVLPTGFTLVRNTTGAIEPIILDPARVDTILDDGGQITGYRYHPPCPDSPANPDA